MIAPGRGSPHRTTKNGRGYAYYSILPSRTQGRNYHAEKENAVPVQGQDRRRRRWQAHTNEFTNTEQYLEHVYGYMNRDASELLMKYRKTFLNIDLQIIDELEELFIHLW